MVAMPKSFRWESVGSAGAHRLILGFILACCVTTSYALPADMEQKDEDIPLEEANDALWSSHLVCMTGIAFSPDSRTLVSFSKDVKEWNLKTGKLRRIFPEANLCYGGAILSPDGKRVLCVYANHVLNCWRLDRCKEERLRIPENECRHVYAAALSPDGKRVALKYSVPFVADKSKNFISSHNFVKLWDLESGKELAIFKETDGRGDIQISPDGRCLAALQTDQTALPQTVDAIAIFEIATRKRRLLLKGCKDEIRNFLFSPDGKYIAARSWSDIIKVWECGNGRLLYSLPVKISNGNMAFSPDGSLLATSSDETRAIQLWDARTGVHKRNLEKYRKSVTLIVYSPDGKTMATVYGGFPPQIKLWDVESGKSTLTIKEDLRVGCALAFSADDKTLSTWVGDPLRPGKPGYIQSWNVKRQTPVKTFQGQNSWITRCAAFSSDGAWLCEASNYPEKLKRTNCVILSKPERNESVSFNVDQPATACAFSRRHNLLLAGVRDKDGPGGKILIWNLKTKERGHVIETDEFDCLAITPDGKMFVSAGRQGDAILWSIDSGKTVRRFGGESGFIGCVAISPEGNILAAGNIGRTIALWNLKTGEMLGFLTGHKAMCRSLLFLPDGKSLVSAGEDSEVKVWDAQKKKERFTLRGHSAAVICAAVSHNGKTLATSSHDGTIRLWDLLHGKEVGTCVLRKNVRIGQ